MSPLLPCFYRVSRSLFRTPSQTLIYSLSPYPSFISLPPLPFHKLPNPFLTQYLVNPTLSYLSLSTLRLTLPLPDPADPPPLPTSLPSPVFTRSLHLNEKYYLVFHPVIMSFLVSPSSPEHFGNLYVDGKHNMVWFRKLFVCSFSGSIINI